MHTAPTRTAFGGHFGAGKRLPSNAEWQVAALATPDDGSCIVDAADPGPTGTASCVSEWAPTT